MKAEGPAENGLRTAFEEAAKECSPEHRKLLEQTIRKILEPAKQRASTDVVQCELDEFIRTGNPMAAWQCWTLAREAGAEPPDEIMQYVDRVATRFVELGSKTLGRIDPILGHVLGLTIGQKGRGSDISKYVDAERESNLGVQVHYLVNHAETPMKKHEAISLVAERNNVTEKTVKDAWLAKKWVRKEDSAT